MALFFDAKWFDARLEQVGLSRTDIATALGLSGQQVDELWKDQRELKVADVRVLAALLGTEPAEIANRSGISTPVPKPNDAGLSELAARLDRIEAVLLELKAEMRALVGRS